MEDTNTPKRKLEDTTDDRQAKKKRTGDGESRNLKFEDNVDTSGEKRVFDGLYICVAGRLKKTRHDTSNFIKKHGGYFTKHVSKKLAFFVTTNECIAADNTASVQKAAELGVPLVSEKYIYDCVKAGRLLDFKDYKLTGRIEDDEREDDDNMSIDSQEDREMPNTRSATKRRQREEKSTNDIKQETKSKISQKKDEKSTQAEASDNTFLINSSKKLVSDLKKLVGKGDSKPLFADVAFIVGNEKFWAPKAVLCVRSEYFKNLLIADPSAVEITLEKNVNPSVFECVVNYLCSGDMNVEDVDTAIGVYEFSKQIQCKGAQKLGVKFIETKIQEFINAKDISKGIQVMDILIRKGLKDPAFYDPILNFILANGALLVDSQEFNNISKPMLKELLESPSLHVNEVDLFEKVIKWGIINLSKEKKKETPGQPPSDDAMQVAEEGKDDHIVQSSELREYLKDILPLILFEHMSQTAIFKNVESKKIFTQEELLEFCKAAVNVKNGDPYTILGHTYVKGRPKRKYQVVSVNKGVYNYSFKLADLNNKLFFPEFELCGSRWFVCVQLWKEYLSVFVYNKHIFDGGILSGPIVTTIRFTLFNKNPEKNKVSGFTKTWDKVKAWGYSNFIEHEGLSDPQNGWVDRNGNLTIEVSITKKEE